jgi:hypothetical protein
MAVSERARARPIAAPQSITITVGVHGSEGADPHAGASFAADGAMVPGSALTVADIARFHEFGVSPFQLPSGAVHPGIPQRSFIRAWFDESQEFIAATLRSQMQQVIAGKLTAETASARIALAFEGSVKERIARGIPPPLSPVTIALKGSSKPLIDTGQLRSSVRSRSKLTTGDEVKLLNGGRAWTREDARGGS